MNTYWDLTDKERAALSREDVERYIDAELMMKGVLKVREPELIAVPEPKLQRRSYYVVSANSRYGNSDIEVAFERVEDAKAFVALAPFRIEAQYMGHENQSYVRAVDPFAVRITTVELPSAADVDAMDAALRAAGAAKAANEAAQKKYRDQRKLQDEALHGLFEDWNECRAKDARLRRVMETLGEYARIAGSAAVAVQFLRKVFSDAEILAAHEWAGLAAPELTGEDLRNAQNIPGVKSRHADVEPF